MCNNNLRVIILNIYDIWNLFMHGLLLLFVYAKI